MDSQNIITTQGSLGAHASSSGSPPEKKRVKLPTLEVSCQFLTVPVGCLCFFGFCVFPFSPPLLIHYPNPAQVEAWDWELRDCRVGQDRASQAKVPHPANDTLRFQTLTSEFKLMSFEKVRSASFVTDPRDLTLQRAHW